MTSPRRKRDRPIESVALKITFRAGKEASEKIRLQFPGAKVRGGVCEVRIEGERPGEVAEQAKVLLERVRKSV